MESGTKHRLLYLYQHLVRHTDAEHTLSTAELKVLVDAINDAIDTKRKIVFCYTDFDINKQRCLANNGEPYTVSPYTLIWDGNYYYMRGFCNERQEMRNFRIDRIYEQPKICGELPDGVRERRLLECWDRDGKLEPDDFDESKILSQGPGTQRDRGELCRRRSG